MVDLFTLEELASHLQRDLDTATATLARASATDTVRAATKQTLTAVTGDVAYLQVSRNDDTVTLPQRPVTAVTSIYTVSDTDGTTETLVPAADWRWPRGDEVVAKYCWGQSLLKVTYSHGSDDPAFLATAKRIGLAVAGRLVDNPAGVKQESIDDYSRTLVAPEGPSLLTEQEARELRDQYGSGAAFSVVPR